MIIQPQLDDHLFAVLLQVANHTLSLYLSFFSLSLCLSLSISISNYLSLSIYLSEFSPGKFATPALWVCGVAGSRAQPLQCPTIRPGRRGSVRKHAGLSAADLASSDLRFSPRRLGGSGNAFIFQRSSKNAPLALRYGVTFLWFLKSYRRSASGANRARPAPRTGASWHNWGSFSPSLGPWMLARRSLDFRELPS